MEKLLLINIAGFASNGKNKMKQLQKMFPDAIIENVLTSGKNPHNVIEEINHTMNQHNNVMPIFVGSSLGGFYAHFASVKLQCNAVLINPSLQPWKTLQDKLGENQYFNGDTFVVIQKDLDAMEEMVETRKHVYGLYDEIDDPSYALFTGSMDERLDHTITRSLLQFPTIDCTVAGYDHRFEDISIIKSAIELLEKDKIAIEDDSFTPHDPFGDDED